MEAAKTKIKQKNGLFICFFFVSVGRFLFKKKKLTVGAIRRRRLSPTFPTVFLLFLEFYCVLTYWVPKKYVLLGFTEFYRVLKVSFFFGFWALYWVFTGKKKYLVNETDVKVKAADAGADARKCVVGFFVASFLFFRHFYRRFYPVSVVLTVNPVATDFPFHF